MGETITNLWFCGWREGEACSASRAGKKTKKKQEREKKLSHLSFLPSFSRSTKTKAKVCFFFVYLQHTRSLFITTRSLARYYTHRHTRVLQIPLSLSLPLKTSTTTTITITVRSKNTRADRTFSFPSTRSCARRVPTFVKIPPGSRRSAPLRRL